jgi:Dna[CI] antecedent, DciA
VNEELADFDRLGDLLREACGPVPSAEAIPLTNGRRVDERAHGGQGPGSDAGRTAEAARMIAEVWEEAVGLEVAANARPVQLRRGRLTVSASSSAWAQTLQLMAETVKDRLNDRLCRARSAEAVKDIVFRHAGWEEGGSGVPSQAAAGGGWAGPGERGAAATGAAPAPTPEEEAAVAEVKRLGLEQELQESILRAMRTSFGQS